MSATNRAEAYADPVSCRRDGADPLQRFWLRFDMRVTRLTGSPPATATVADRSAADATWPRLVLASGDTVTLESIGFGAPLAAFYRTAA